MTDDELLVSVLTRLQAIPIEVRRPFGSRRLYHEGHFFGFVDGGHLYFRTNDANRADYLDRGMPAYMPAGRVRGPRTVDRNFQVPAEVLQDVAELVAWALRAIEAAG